MGKNDTSPDAVKAGNNEKVGHEGQPSDFFVGLVTFIVFIIFMSAWMYFSL